MRRFFRLCAALCLCVLVAHSQQPAQPSPNEEFQALQAHFARSSAHALKSVRRR